jgi:hypothetical protein
VKAEMGVVDEVYHENSCTLQLYYLVYDTRSPTAVRTVLQTTHITKSLSPRTVTLGVKFFPPSG